MEMDSQVKLQIGKLQLSFGGVFALDKMNLDVREISVPL